MIDYRIVYQIEAPNGKLIIKSCYLSGYSTPGSTRDCDSLIEKFTDEIKKKEPSAFNIFIVSFYPIL